MVGDFDRSIFIGSFSITEMLSSSLFLQGSPVHVVSERPDKVHVFGPDAPGQHVPGDL